MIFDYQVEVLNLDFGVRIVEIGVLIFIGLVMDGSNGKFCEDVSDVVCGLYFFKKISIW